jgi:TRAP-type C4-dicarboxylate transport system substrate-binding protein
LVMNRKKFESLPAEAQAIIRKHSGDQSALRTASGFDALNREIVKKLEADSRRKVVFPSPADLATSKHVFDKVIAQWADLKPHNHELLTRVRAEIAKFNSTN